MSKQTPSQTVGPYFAYGLAAQQYHYPLGQVADGAMAGADAPVGIQEVEAGSRALPDGSRRDVNGVRTTRVLPSSVASTETSMLETVLQYGTGRAAAIGQFAAGKTGTTSNYGDAWFVGWDSKYTVAVWVGYPDKLIPMTTDFNGGPVLGGTFPALIWHDFMVAALGIDKARAENAANHRSGSGKGTGTGAAESSPASGAGEGSGQTSSAPSTTATPAPSGGKVSAPSQGAGGGNSSQGGGGAAGGSERAPATPSTPPAAAAPQSSPAPSATPAPSAPAAPTGGSSPTGGVAPGG